MKCTNCFEWSTTRPCEHCGAPIPSEPTKNELQIAEDVYDRLRGGPRAKMKALANECQMPYEELMRKLKEIVEGDEDAINLSFDSPNYHPQDMWGWYELITGEVVSHETRQSWVFNCAC